jgi:hypothetical protein
LLPVALRFAVLMCLLVLLSDSLYFAEELLCADCFVLSADCAFSAHASRKTGVCEICGTNECFGKEQVFFVFVVDMCRIIKFHR